MMKAKILVVDDEPPFELMIRKIFRKEINENQYAFFFARNGEDALHTLEEIGDIEMLLTDINMPVMDGLALMAEVEKRFPDLVTIVISAYGDIQNIRKTMNAGAFDFLVKPLSREDLKMTLVKAMKQILKNRELQQAYREKELAQRELVDNLKRMDRTKDEFLTSVSHELLTPLNGIVGIADSLADGAVGPVSDDMCDNLQMIVSSGKRLTSLVHDILDISKMKNSELKLMTQPLDLRPVIEVVLSLSQPLVGIKPLVLRKEFPTSFPRVLADENRVEQILHNLIGNAVKYTPSGEVCVFLEHDESNAYISIRDSGIGIPEHKFEAIFMPFEQMDGSMTRPYGGAGLGLSITRQLVQLQNGQIDLKSEVGKGSTFTFSLPLVPGDGPVIADPVVAPNLVHEVRHLEKSVDMPQPVTENGFRILAVDDEPVNQRVLQNQFTIEGYHVDTVGSGYEALEAVATNACYDLVLLDVMMPGLNGFDVCRKLRENFSLVELPILILTAKNHTRAYLEGISCGANDYLAKPFDKSELMARAKTLLSLRQAVAQTIEHTRHLESERLKRGLAENLRKITETLTSTLELKEVLARFLECLAPVCFYSRALIVLKKQDRVELAIAKGFGDDSVLTSSHQVAETFLPLTEAHDEALVINYDSSESNHGALSIGIEVSLVAAPFFTKGIQIGLILLERDKPRKFRPQECELLSAFAGQAAIAIENAQLFEKVQVMAKTEELTGLNNRRHFFSLGNDAFEHAVSEGRPLSAIMLDVDHFKMCNDTYGHAVGDEVLQTVAKRIMIACRRSDILGRYGGEEFAIILPDTTLEVAKDVAERLRIEIQKNQASRKENIKITASLGVAELDRTVHNLGELLQRADVALYRAKEKGRNCSLTYPEAQVP